MTFKNQIIRTILNTGTLLAVFASLFFNSISAMAMSNADIVALPAFNDFARAVQNGHKGILRGVYVSDVLALPIIQQPVGYPGFVSKKDGEATQFEMASEVGNIGLLAHNHLAGKSFSHLAIGQEVRLIYGDGTVETFVVTKILRYQALQPNSPGSEFRNLDDKITITAGQLFKQVYRGDRHVTFQTCIANEGNLSWGRLFVIAEPKTDVSASDINAVIGSN